jgi:hypothetical protein
MRKILLITIAAALAAVLAGCSGGNGESEEGAAHLEPAGETSAEGGGEVADAQPAAPPARDLPAIGPRVIQTASLAISLRPGRFDEAIDEARDVAATLGGFVVSSSENQVRQGRPQSGSLVVRVPARSYADAIARLGDVGRVERRRESGQDVSAEFVDLESRARHLGAVEQQLLELLDRADTVAAALAVQSKLNEVQLELEQTRGRLRFLDDQVSFATISLSLHERAADTKADDDEGWGIVEAWETAARGFVAAVGWIFIAVATAAPFLALAFLAWLLARSAVRRKIGGVWPRLKSD